MAGSAQPAIASDVAAIAGPGESGIQIQNLDPLETLQIHGSLVGPNDAWLQVVFPPVVPGAAANIWLPGTHLNDGTYAGLFYADGPIAAIARTDWPSSGASGTYSNPVPGRVVAMPLVVSNYYGQSSILTIQNADMAGWTTGTATVELYAVGSATALVSQAYAIAGPTSITLDFGRDREFAAVEDGFLGSAVISSDLEIAVTSFVDIETSDKAVYAFEGVPVEMAQPTLYVPLFRAEQHVRSGDPSSGRLDTGISVVNPNESNVEVSLTYYGAGGSCTDLVVTRPSVAIPARSSHVFWQGAVVSEGLNADCYGSAVVHSTGGGVLAMVNEAQNLSETAAAYTAFTAGQAATTVALPLYRRAHAFGLSTGISVMNVGAENARITVDFNQARGNGSELINCGAPCTRTVAPNRTAIFWTPSIAAIQAGTYGSAKISSTQPVVAIVNDVVLSAAVDMSTYAGIGVNAPHRSAADGVALPYLLNAFTRP